MIVALEEYNYSIIAEIISNSYITGVVVGDLFCDYRMFAGGKVEMMDCICNLKNAAKEVYIQTKCYMTNEVVEETINEIVYLAKKDLIDGIIIQDVGLFKEIRNAKINVDIIWGQMNAGRSNAVNLLFYRFLQSMGDIIIATDDITKAKILEENRVKTVLILGKLEYSTVGRVCYTVYENNLYGVDCKRRCLKTTQCMVNEKNGISMSIDGYMLGKRYRFLICEENVLRNRKSILYVSDYEQFNKQIKKLMGGYK